MTDTTSSGNAPSPVVCMLAKLGRLSPPVTVKIPYADIVSSSPPLRSRRLKRTMMTPATLALAASKPSITASCESLEYSSSRSSDHRFSDVSCDGRARIDVPSATVLPYTQSSTFRYHRHAQHHQPQRKYESPFHSIFYTPEKHQQMQSDENISPAYFQTSLGYHSAGRNSPYLDQGYHTLVSPSPPGWPTAAVTAKCKKALQKCSHIVRLPDVVMLHIFSWLSTNELCFVSRVCRWWYNLAWDISLWKTITLHGEGISGDKAIKNILRRLCGQGQNSSSCTVKQLFVFDGAKISDKGLTSLARRCTELTHVQLQNCPMLTDSSVSELVSRCHGILHLDLTGCSLVSCITIIPGLLDLPQKLLLQHLDLTDCISVQDSSLRIILRNCPQLTYLYLRRCSRITDAGIKFVPSFCSSLRELSMSDCHLITDFALYELAMLGSNLRYLSVAKCDQVSDAGLKVIAKRCYKLRYLNVRGCEAVSDDALTALARSCPRLRALDIGKCDISDTGLKVLAENCPNLKKLSLRNCDLVTDRGIQYVCYYCRGLQQLNIQDCQISLEGYKAVKRFCKRCIIEHTNPAFF